MWMSSGCLSRPLPNGSSWNNSSRKLPRKPTTGNGNSPFDFRTTRASTKPVYEASLSSQTTMPWRRSSLRTSCSSARLTAPASVIDQLLGLVLVATEERPGAVVVCLRRLPVATLQLVRAEPGSVLLVLGQKLRPGGGGAGLVDCEVGPDLILESQLPRVRLRGMQLPEALVRDGEGRILVALLLHTGREVA